MEQARLERDLIRCRYLLTKGAVQRLGLRDMRAIEENWDSFIRECHADYKKAQTILTTTKLEVATEIEGLSRYDPKGEAFKKHAYWLRVLESCYEAFVWVTMHSDVR